MDIDYQVGEVELSYKSTVREKRKIATSSDAYGMLLSTFREDTIGYKEYFRFLIAIAAGILKTRAASKCPQCGQHKLQRSNSVLISRRNGVRTEDVTYTCRNCGHKVVRRQQSYDENYRGGGGGGPVIFGGGGFGSGGGGFSGGSFGGGMGGGGGAGSRF